MRDLTDVIIKRMFAPTYSRMQSEEHGRTRGLAYLASEAIGASVEISKAMLATFGLAHLSGIEVSGDYTSLATMLSVPAVTNLASFLGEAYLFSGTTSRCEGVIE